MTETNRQPGDVQSVHRALDLLEAIARHGEGGVSDSAREVGLTVPTAHNLMKTLTRRQYLVSRGGRYRLGPATSLLASRFAPTLALPALARPMVTSAYEELGYSVFAFVLVGNGIHCIAYGDASVSVESLPDVWGSKPPLEAAAGRMLVAMQPEAEWESFIDNAGDSEPGWSRDDWVAELRAIANLGLCAKCSPAGIAAVSVPVWGPGDHVLASVSCSLRADLADDAVTTRIVDRLWTLTQDLSTDLGAAGLPIKKSAPPSPLRDLTPG